MLAQPQEAFPLANRTSHTAESPSTGVARPWILRFAHIPGSTQAVPLPAALYDEEQQISVGVDTDVMPYMGTHHPTVPDGSKDNPPPLDEGPKD